MNSKETSYTLCRFALGINITLQGFMRLADIQTFSTTVESAFVNTPIPANIIGAACIVLPFAEFIIGLMLTFGLFTQRALIMGGLLVVIVMAGDCVLLRWNATAIKLWYIFFYGGLLYFLELNQWAADNLIARKRRY